MAAFDVDGTLTRRDTLLPFLSYVCGRRALAACLLGRSARLGVSMALDRDRARGRVKESVLRDLLAGRRDDDVREAGERFAGRLVDGPWLRPDTSERWRWHRELGHEVVIVSASLEAYLIPFAALIGGAEVLATRLSVGDDGRLTGGLEGINCRGPEKLARLCAWSRGDVFAGVPGEGPKEEPEEKAGPGSPARFHRPLGDGIELWAYGDSSGDRELLAAAQMAHRIRRRRRLPSRPARERSP
ncbi:MAG: HAD-IB family hydrolase [Streptosporangiaceae bacterium]